MLSTFVLDFLRQLAELRNSNILLNASVNCSSNTRPTAMPQRHHTSVLSNDRTDLLDTTDSDDSDNDFEAYIDLDDYIQSGINLQDNV